MNKHPCIFNRLLSFLLAVVTIFSVIEYAPSANAYYPSSSDNIVTLYEQLPQDIKQYAFEKCSRRGISYSLFLAIAYNESRFQPDAVNINKNGTVDRGMCQINDSCHKFLQSKGIFQTTDQLFNVYINIDCFIALMEYHMSYTKNEYQSLLGYQVGEGAYKNKYANGNLTNKTHQSVWNKKCEMDEYFKENELHLLQFLNPYTYKYLARRYPILQNKDLLFIYISRHPNFQSWKFVFGQ